MRASRLLSILLMLQSRGRMTARELAEAFEVSVRTIHRDIDELSGAEVPVYADRGPGGGFELLDGYRTRLDGLSPREASTLFLAALPGPAEQLGLADLLATAQLKLTAALPQGARATARQVAARFHLDPVGWFNSAGESLLLPVIANAVWDAALLDITYRRSARTVSRRVAPLGLVLKAGVWYLVAQVGETPRTYRVSNILALNVSEERFERPGDFDLVRFWTHASRAYEVGLFRGEATVRLSPRGLETIGKLGAQVAQAAVRSRAPAEADGWVKVVIPIERVDQAASDLARLGADVEVLEPIELREEIAKNARQVAALY